MSRIGKKPILVPKGTEVKINGQEVRVKGPKGSLVRTLHHAVKVEQETDEIKISLVKPDAAQDQRFHGLSRTLVANMVDGVSTGFSKSLTLIGVGYRAAVTGKDLTLSLGFSHPIVFTPPEGIEIKVEKQTTVIVEGASKEDVGQVAANIRGFRPPEPYHGKGVRYSDEKIATKEGKSGGK